MKLLVISLGLVIAAIGIFGIVAPAALVEIGRSLQTTNALYIVAAVRVAFGASLWWAAPNARTPRVFRVLGAFIVGAGLVTPFLGAEIAHDLFDWWATQGPMFTRAWAAFAVVFGMFMIHAITPSHRSAA